MVNKSRIILLVIFVIVVVMGCSKNNRPVISEMNSKSQIILSPEEHKELVKLGIIVENQNREIAEKHKKDLEKAYNQNFPKGQLFEKYIHLIGANGVLDFLEEKFPLCHSQAHDIVRVIFSKIGEIGPSLRACGTRCTSGCMHGILIEAFRELSDSSQPKDEHSDLEFDAHIDAEVVKDNVNSICNSTEFTKVHKIGNCAHGVGHAFMLLSDYKASKAVEYCSYFESKPLRFYCASGANMEYVTVKGNEVMKSQDFSCKEYSEFPAACYRYKVIFLFSSLKASGKKPTIKMLAEECLKLTNLSRLGCFYGMGFAYLNSIYSNTSYLKEVCSFGNADDKEVCIEGTIEKLADYNETRALEACQYLEGNNKRVCVKAAKGGMYRLDKSFRLYFKD